MRLDLRVFREELEKLAFELPGIPKITARKVNAFQVLKGNFKPPKLDFSNGVLQKARAPRLDMTPTGSVLGGTSKIHVPSPKSMASTSSPKP